MDEYEENHEGDSAQDVFTQVEVLNSITYTHEKSENGEELLKSSDGFVYYLTQEDSEGNKTWDCAEKEESSCPAVVTQSADFYVLNQEHDHCSSKQKYPDTGSQGTPSLCVEVMDLPGFPQA